MNHERFLSALQEFREGKLTEETFLALWTTNQRQGLMKAMEKDRKSNGLEGWDNLSGEGSKCKERKLLLQFLSSGKLEQAAVSQETRA